MNILIILTAKYLYLIIIVLALGITFLDKKNRFNIAKLAILSFPFSFIVAKILNFFIQDPRPFVVEHIQPLIAHAKDNGFPSDHTLLSMTVASVIFAYNKKLGMILAVLAVLVGVGRVLAHVHHPLDIIGSIVIAILTTHISWHILRYLKGDKKE